MGLNVDINLVCPFMLWAGIFNYTLAFFINIFSKKTSFLVSKIFRVFKI